MGRGTVQVSVLTCPICRSQREEVMSPVTALLTYECRSCHEVLRPGPGDCCVFCCYGSVKYPPAQVLRPEG
jgi:hypothetical protein